MIRLLLLIVLISPSVWAGTPCYPPPESWKTDGADRAFVLYRGINLEAMSQGSAPSCVACAAAKAMEITNGRPFAADWLYGASRVDRFIIGPGSQCGWVAELVTNKGAIPSIDLPIMDVDLSVYSAQRAVQWERGPPEELYQIAELYKSAGYYHIHSWEELRGAITNGYPVIVGSNVGFGPRVGQTRDEGGELNSRWWSRWSHAMLYIGIDDAGANKASLVLNSWGPDWVDGPQRLGDEPEGSFWVDKRSTIRMIEQGDAYVLLPIRGM